MDIELDPSTNSLLASEEEGIFGGIGVASM